MQQFTIAHDHNFAFVERAPLLLIERNTCNPDA